MNTPDQTRPTKHARPKTRPTKDTDPNWLQVLDAILDPIHTAFLHSRISREQFSEGFGAIGEMKFTERQMGYLGTATRRVGENVWVRTNELVLPNFTQAGAAFAADGTRQIYYGRTAWMLTECWKDYEVLIDGSDKPVARGRFEMRHGPQRIGFKPPRSMTSSPSTKTHTSSPPMNSRNCLPHAS